MQGPLETFTPEKWDIVKRVLSGEDDNKVSLAAAAKAAGVKVRDINQWVKRSREALPHDDPLILEIAEFYDSIKELQAGRLQDEAWQRAVEGVDQDVWHKGEVVGSKNVKDDRILMRLLEARDDDYKKAHVPVAIVSNSDLIFAKLLAASRLAEADAEAIEDKRNMIDADYETVE